MPFATFMRRFRKNTLSLDITWQIRTSLHRSWIWNLKLRIIKIAIQSLNIVVYYAYSHKKPKPFRHVTSLHKNSDTCVIWFLLFWVWKYSLLFWDSELVCLLWNTGASVKFIARQESEHRRKDLKQSVHNRRDCLAIFNC